MKGPFGLGGANWRGVEVTEGTGDEGIARTIFTNPLHAAAPWETQRRFSYRGQSSFTRLRVNMGWGEVSVTLTASLDRRDTASPSSAWKMAWPV